MWRACGASFIVQRHRNNPELTPTRAAPPQYLKKNDTDGASGRLYAARCSIGSTAADHTGHTGHDRPFRRGTGAGATYGGVRGRRTGAGATFGGGGGAGTGSLVASAGESL